MKSLSRMLVATDFSVPARQAVSRAFELAAVSGAQLTLMHVLSQSALDGLRRLAGIEPAAVEQSLIEDARQQLALLVAEQGRAHGLQAEARVAAGGVLTTLLDGVDALNADLLVVGARSNDTVGRLFLGTTAERLLRYLRRPVLMVRHAPKGAYRRVLVPVDFSDWSHPAIDAARAVAPEAELVLLHAFVAPFESRLRLAGVKDAVIEDYLRVTRKEAMDKLHALMDVAGLRPQDVRCCVTHGDAPFVILAQAQQEECDLIVVGKHGQGVVEQFLLGSVTKHILAESDGDVLVVTA